MTKNTLLLTGAAGFVGTSVLDYAIQHREELGYDDIVVVDNLITGIYEPLFRACKKHDFLHFYCLDIKEEKLERVFEKHLPKHVIHLAAEPYIPKSFDLPKDFLDTNIYGSYNLFINCIRWGVEKLINYSTSEVYGSAQHIPMSETHPLNPQSFYATTKLAAERFAINLHHEQDLPVVNLRQFNVYGEWNQQPYVIPEIIKQIYHNDKNKDGSINVYLGNNSARDFLYVRDAAQIPFKLLEHGVLGETYNCGAETAYYVYDIVDIISDIMRVKTKIIEDPERLRPNDVTMLWAECSKLKKCIGEYEKTEFKDGLINMIQFYYENGNVWGWENRL